MAAGSSRGEDRPSSMVTDRGPLPMHGGAPAARVRMLGTFELVVDGRAVPDRAWGRRKARQLVKILLGRPGRRAPREQVLEWLWPDSTPEAAATNLRTTVHALRRALREAGLAGSPGGGEAVLVEPDAVALGDDLELATDADEFEALLGRASRAVDPFELLEAADALYQGDYLPDDLYEEWASGRRETLRRQWIGLQAALAEHRERRGDLEGACLALERVLGADPCDERTGRALISLHLRSGRRAEGLHVYQRLLRALRESLGVTPSPETLELGRQLREDAVPGGPGMARSDVEPRRAGGPGVPPASVPRPRTARPPFTPSYPFPAPPELIGRSEVLAAVERTLAGGRIAGRSVLIGGAAGAGKSTLLGAMARQAAGAGFLCLVGGSYSRESPIPLGPFRDALADYLLDRPAEDVRALLGEAAGDLAQVVPELRHHLGLPERTATDDQGQVFGAVHACIRALAADGPVLLCLDDLHDADAATLSLLRFLVRQGRRLPVTIAAAYRVEEATAGSPLAGLVAALRREGSEHLTLALLSDTDSSGLASRILGGPVGPGLRAWLYDLSEGNPLYVEQLALALHEERRLVRRQGAWELAETVQPGGLPLVVREVIGQRFGRLSPRCRATLELAAVRGLAVDHDLLVAALAPADEAEALADIEEALRAHLLRESAHGYTFSHALLREALYWEISLPRRIRLHDRVGRTLEQRAGRRVEDRAAELAHHFSRAGGSAEVRRRVVRYSILAGCRAAELSSHREAFEHFSRALALLEDDEGLADLGALLDAIEGLGNALHSLGRWSECVERLRQVLELTDDPARRGRARIGISRARVQLGDTDAALAALDAGLDELSGAATPEAAEMRLWLQHNGGLVWFLRGRYDRARELGRRMIADATALGQPASLFRAYSVAAWAEMGQARVEPALGFYREALRAAERVGSRIQMAVAYENLGIQQYRGAHFREARPNLERAVALYGAATGESRAVNALQTLGRVQLAVADLAGAEAYAAQAQALAIEQGDRWIAECDDLLGRMHLLRCTWEHAVACFESALLKREGVGHAAGTVESLLGLGLAHELHGDDERADAAYTRALEVAREMDACPQLLAVLRQCGWLRYRSGDASGAATLDEARALVETMPESIEAAGTWLALAKRARDADPRSALRMLQSALQARPTAELDVEINACGAEIALRVGDLVAAQAAARQADQMARILATPRTIGLASLAVARVQHAEGHHEASARALASARQAFATARTPHDLTVADAMASGVRGA